MQYKIYWTPQTQLRQLQGATVDFQALDQVTYEHFFLPSGQVIATWHSRHLYPGEKRISDLPQLLRGETYIIERHIEASERMFAYLIVTFFDEQHQVLDMNSQNIDQMTVTVPEDYAFYTIDLVSAGNGQFVFHDLLIRPKKSGILREGDMEIAPKLYTNIEFPPKITSKTLRVVFSEPETNTTDYMSEWIKETQQVVQYIVSSQVNAGYYRQHEEAVITSVKSARKQARARQIEFVGYGPISSYAALYYQEQFKGSQAVISDDVELEPAPALKVRRTIDEVSYLGNPIMPNYQVPITIAHPIYERLSMLTYDTPTPEEVRRQQEYQAAHPKKNAISLLFTKNKNNTQ